MKTILKYIFSLGAMVVATGMVSCYKPIDHSGGYLRPAVREFTPAVGNSVENAARPGSSYTLIGVNLTNAARVTVNDVEAQITSKSFRELTFIVPMIEDLAQNEVHETFLAMYSDRDEGEQYSWKAGAFYLYVTPYDAMVTNLSATEGLIGDEITLTGFNLDEVSSIDLGGQTIDKAAFIEQTTESIIFAIPDAEYQAGNYESTISFVWGENDTRQDVAAFTIKTPAVDPVEAPSTPPGVLQEITFTGVNLDQVTSMWVGEYEAAITAQTATSLTIIIPNEEYSAEPTNPLDVAITAKWGAGKTLVVAEAYPIDPTPPAIVPPTDVEFTPADGGPEGDKFYLRKEVTVTGTGMQVVNEVLIKDGANDTMLEAEITGTTTATTLKFTMPEDFTFDTKTSCQVIFKYGDDLTTFIASEGIDVYPFYYWKGMRVGVGSASVANAGAFAADNAFFLPDEGRVVSALEWFERPVDQYVIDAQTTMSSANTLNKGVVTSAEAYYAVTPYIFFNSDSGFVMNIPSPSNSASQLKNQRYFNEGTGKYVSVAGNFFGAPVMAYRVMAAASEKANWANKVTDGSIESLAATDYGYDGSFASSGAPKYGAETSSTFVEGSVVLVQYSTYEKGGRATAAADLRAQGFMYITDITCLDGSDPTAKVGDWETGYVEFDFYWSKPLN